jgi:spermidine/putrescine-binding protein
MPQKLLTRGGLVAVLLLALLATMARPAAAAKTAGNMLVIACYDDYYDCKPPCNYKYCC